MNRNTKGVVLNLPYAGSVWHWAQMMASDRVVIEAHGRYQRRTHRTRTTIMAANGPLSISVPVERDESQPYRDIRINYDTPWQQQHLRALLSAYNSTPFYEFYADDFEKIYNANHEHVWDLNMALMHLVAELIGIEIDYELTEAFAPAPKGYDDLRIAIEPKYDHLLTQGCEQRPYYQVFAQRYGFTPGLSILDMLFNLGPESIFALREMAQQIRNNK